MESLLNGVIACRRGINFHGSKSSLKENTEKSLQREHHISQTVNDIMKYVKTLNGTIVFLKLDLIKRYQQLQQASAFYLPNISAHAGLKWYEKLTSGIYSATETFQDMIPCIILVHLHYLQWH